MDEKYKELVGAIAECRGSHLRLLEGMEDHSLKVNDLLNTNPKADAALSAGRAWAKETQKLMRSHSSAIDKLDKITSSVDAPRFRHNFSNFKLPAYPVSSRFSLGNSQENRQKEYKLWKQDRVLEYLVTQEQDYLKKYEQLFQGEGKAIGDWGKVKEFLKKHRKWLIPAIASTITGIIGPIIAWIVIRKLGG